MDINWSINSVVNFIPTISNATVFISFLWVIHRGWRYRFNILMAISMFFYLICWTLITAGNLFFFRELVLLGNLFVIIGGLFLLLGSDLLSRDAVDPIKLFIYAGLITIILFMVISGNPETTSTNISFFFFIYLAACFLPLCVFLYYLVKINQQVPRHLKMSSRLLVIGFLTGNFIGIFLVLFSGGGFFSDLILATGFILQAWVLVRSPMIFFILTQKAMYFSVIDTSSGIPLFTHTWKSKAGTVNEDLFSGMLQGISLIVKETLNRGNMEEVKLSEGVLIVQRSRASNVACVLVATKSSRALRDGLHLFSERFGTQYGPLISDPINKALFEPASSLIAECFPFLPE